MRWSTIIKQSKNTLLIENSKRRIIKTVFRKGIDIKSVATNEEEIDFAMQEFNFETLWVDYDLTRIWKLKNRQNSLRALKKYSCYLKDSGVKLIVIHSWNPIGVYKLYKEFKNLEIKIIIKRHWKMF